MGPALRVGPEPLFSDEMFSTEEAERAEAEAERAAMEVEWPEAPAPRDEGEAVTVDGPSATPDETQLLETSQLEVPAEPFGGEAQEPAAEGFEQEAPQEWATPEPWPQETLDATSPMRGRPESGGLEGERAEAEHREAERLEAERAEAEHSEAERAEAERLERERAEAERAEAERAEAERAEADRLEAERLEAARAEAEREGGPRRRVRPPTGAAELEGIELALREGEVESVAGRLALLLRTEPTLAPRIVELASWAVRLTGGSGVDAANLHLVRGDGYRLLGRDSEAEAAYEASRRALEPRWPAGSAW